MLHVLQELVQRLCQRANVVVRVQGAEEVERLNFSTDLQYRKVSQKNYTVYMRSMNKIRNVLQNILCRRVATHSHFS